MIAILLGIWLGAALVDSSGSGCNCEPVPVYAAPLAQNLSGTDTPSHHSTSWLTPPWNVLIPFTCNVTYHCEVETGPVVWRISSENCSEYQINVLDASDRKANFENTTGTIIQTNVENGSVSELTVTPLTRDHCGPHPVIECHPSDLDIREHSVPNSTVIAYGPLPPPSNLTFLESEFALSWEVNIPKPDDFPPDVQITSHVIVTNTSSNESEEFQTNGTFWSLSDSDMFDGKGQCNEFNFSVFLSEECLGNTSPVNITQWLPVGPDVSSIVPTVEVQLKKHSVKLTIKFHPIEACGYSVLNYSVNVIDTNVTLPATTCADGLICVFVDQTVDVGLAKDQIINYTITACNSMACQTTDTTYTAFTMDVQRPIVFFTQNSSHMILTCEFASGSKASGCLFILSLTSTDKRELHNITVQRNSKVNSTVCPDQKGCKCVMNPYTESDLDQLSIEVYPLGVPSVVSLFAVVKNVSGEGEYLMECDSEYKSTIAVVVAVIAVIGPGVILALVIAAAAIIYCHGCKRNHNSVRMHKGDPQGGDVERDSPLPHPVPYSSEQGQPDLRKRLGINS